mmetsp:Transcript_41197/g.129420  ORF Transcript_41197/g.129420 Transcript_41197/m.129420 type:complete len:242 (+) Transcript_41197:1730-2455(+)
MFRNFLRPISFILRLQRLVVLPVVRLLQVVPPHSFLETRALLVQHELSPSHQAHLPQKPFTVVVGSEGNRVDGRRGACQALHEALNLLWLIDVSIRQQPDLRPVAATHGGSQRSQQATRHAPRASRADHLVLSYSLLRAGGCDPSLNAPQLLLSPPAQLPRADLLAATSPRARRTFSAMRVVPLVESQELEHPRPPPNGAKRTEQAGDELLELSLPLPRHRSREVGDEDWRLAHHAVHEHV